MKSITFNYPANATTTQSAATPETPLAAAENPSTTMHAAAIEDASVADHVAARAVHLQGAMTEQDLVDTFTLVVSLGSQMIRRARRHANPVGRDNEHAAATYWLKKLRAGDDEWASAAPNGDVFKAGFAIDLDTHLASAAGVGAEQFISCVHLSLSGADVMRLKNELDDREITTGAAAAGLHMAAGKIDEAAIFARANFDPEHSLPFSDLDATKTAALFAVAAVLAPEREAEALRQLIASRAAHGVGELSAASKTLVEAAAKATAALVWKKEQVEADRLVNAHDTHFTEIPAEERARLTRKHIDGEAEADVECLAQMAASGAKGARQLAWLVVEATGALKRARRDAAEMPLDLLHDCPCGGAADGASEVAGACNHPSEDGLPAASCFHCGTDACAGNCVPHLIGGKRARHVQATDAESDDFDATLRSVMEDAPGGPPVVVALAQGPSMGPMQATLPL